MGAYASAEDAEGTYHARIEWGLKGFVMTGDAMGAPERYTGSQKYKGLPLTHGRQWTL